MGEYDMPRVHRRKAAKNYPEDGIKKGDIYYTWKFRWRRPCRSLKRPRPSQLTQSEFLGQAYSLQEQVEDMESPALSEGEDGVSNFADNLRTIADEVRSLGEEQADKVYNMPESLQESETADLLNQRNEACESLSDEIEQAADEISSMDASACEDDEDLQSEIQSYLDGISWDFEC